MTWLQVRREGLSLTLHIQPGAKKTEVAGPHGDALKIRLAAPPVDGKANAALIEFLADRLGVAKSTVVLKSGQASRRKVVEVVASEAFVRAQLVGDRSTSPGCASCRSI